MLEVSIRKTSFTRQFDHLNLLRPSLIDSKLGSTGLEALAEQNASCFSIITLILLACCCIKAAR